MDAVKLNRTDLDIVETTNYHPVRDGYVWQTCIVRESDGQLAYWDIPLGPLGGTR